MEVVGRFSEIGSSISKSSSTCPTADSYSLILDDFGLIFFCGFSQSNPITWNGKCLLKEVSYKMPFTHMIKAVGEAPLNPMCPLHKNRNRSSRRFMTPNMELLRSHRWKNWPHNYCVSTTSLDLFGSVQSLGSCKSSPSPKLHHPLFQPNTSGVMFSKWQFMDTNTMSHCFQTSHLMPQEGFHAQQALSLLLVEFVAENVQIWICKWKLSAYQVNTRHMII